MGVIGQLPSAPDELPGREIGTGEPPFERDRGPAADALPTLAPGASRSVSVSLPSAPQPPDSAASDGRVR